MKSLALSLMMFAALTTFAQPANGSWAAGDPVASVQSGAWTDTASWDCACIPSTSNDVAIQTGHTVLLAEGDTARTESLAIADGAALDLPDGARIEIASAFSSIGQVNGRGIVALVGEGPHVCGPASLEHLACGSASVSFADTVSIRSQLDIESASVNTNGLLILAGNSGLTNVSGALIGQAKRFYTWEKLTPFTYLAGAGMESVLVSVLMDQPGAIYVKSWDEPSTAYVSQEPSDELSLGHGHMCYLPAGIFDFEMTGTPVLESSVLVSAESASEPWRGWNLLSNPLTGFVDLNETTIHSGQLGATYFWVDSLKTFVAQVRGLGQFGNKGIVKPGEAFWTIVDSTSNWSVNSQALKTKAEWSDQHLSESITTLSLKLTVGDRKEQCVISFGEGAGTYSPNEDAAFHSHFKGRNNLDIYSKSADDVALMVNRTSSDAQIIPLWVRAFNGESVQISAEDVPQGMCLHLEDIQTGLVQEIQEGFSLAFDAYGSVEAHRFNLIVGESLSVSSIQASCPSAQDGIVEVEGIAGAESFSIQSEDGTEIESIVAEGNGAVFDGLGVGSYIILATTEFCGTLAKVVTVESGAAGFASFDIEVQPDHIGCYDDHGGVTLEIEGGLAPYTVEWSHGATGSTIEVESAGVLDAIVTDAAGCSDSTTVEVLAAPQVQAGIEVEEAVVTLMDGEAEVYFENTSSGATAFQWNFGDGGSSISENPIHAYSAAGAYTVGLNAWNDYCSDTYQMVVTVETVSSIGSSVASHAATLERTRAGWQVHHLEEAFTVEVFDLTGRIVHRAQGAPGAPAILDPSVMPAVALVHWIGDNSGRHQTWRVAR